MKADISSSAAYAAALTAIAARVFTGLVLEAPGADNGAWISALLGGLLAVPWVLGIDWLRSHVGPDTTAMLPLDILLLLGSIADAALMLRALTQSAGYFSIDQAGSFALSIPAVLALTWCLLRGGDAIGYGAMLWIRIFGALMATVFLLQYRYYQPQWLRPLLGSGWRQIAIGAARTARYVMLASCVLLFAKDKEQRRFRISMPLRALAGGAAAATLLILLRLMMAPTMISERIDWVDRLDTLILNGRTPIYLQLPMMIMWFGGTMHLLACECYTATTVMQRRMARLPWWICVVIVLLIVGILSSLPNPGEGCLGPILEWESVALPLCAAFAILCWKGGDAPCAA